MNAKYALALILALQVSMSLCQPAAPSDELVAKYDEMKATFFKRLLVAYGKLQAIAAPYVERAGDSESGQRAKEYIEVAQTKPEFQAIAKVATGLGQEVSPLVDKARTSVLGMYEQHLRPYIGESLNDGINHLKVILDKVLPAE
uniref:Apolipoprotein 14 kDa n=1 Tax=Oplegnathus fasciatus TaxID=163134 RepID=B3VTP7_OPLFA|nr:apolipoprotein 14 kDa [Oplegnathus fasciatus]